MKKKRRKALLYSALMLAGCSFFSTENASANQLDSPASSSNIQSQPDNDKEPPHIAQSLLPALTEPQEHQEERAKKRQDKIEKAMKEAREKSERLMKERDQEWEAAFPVVEGDSFYANFLNSIAKDSVRIAREADLYPSVMMAQAGLESGWGRSGLAKNYNNLFGIKGSFNGKKATLETWEDVNGSHITIKSGFRAYPSKAESLMDYANLLRNGLRGNPSFYSGTWRSKTDSYKDATNYLEGRYATDTRYEEKLNDLIERFDLARFDEVKEKDTSEIVVEPVIPEDPPLPEDKYLVKEGDTVQLILHKSGLSLEEFMEQNNLEEARVHVNQVVSVSPVSDKEVDDEDASVISTFTPSLFVGKGTETD